ncbi:uncharacterized protein LOC121800672 [Salvia splendens]|uniref:uncharacterized protein LOC121800672 n=1 Tax=Salvia splendens TaxID=180675 RepID=UPI001C2611A9|nr:uncharacterized protein LOC121800672 [Salvia splendens]
MNGRGGRAQPPPAEDTSSPYSLHPSDNPGVVLVPQQLIGSNYTTWSRSFTTALLAKNKLVFVDGSIPRPSREDLLYQPWIRCNSMVIAWLRNSVSSQICSSIMYLDDAYEIWSDLKERFSLGDSARLYQLRQQLMSLSQGNSDVSSYFTNLRIIWDEFKNSQPISWCTCARCTCHNASRWYQHQENDCTMQFLIGLNPSFSQIISHILSITPLPSLSKVFALVIQEERQRYIEGNQSTPLVPSEQPFANATSNYDRGLSKFLCTHCGRTNHSVDMCFYLHGFPPGFGRGKSKPSSATGSGGSGFSKPQQHRSVNFVEESSSSSDLKMSPLTAMNLPSMDQYQQLVSLLQSQLHTQSPTSTPEPPTQPPNTFSGTISFSSTINSIKSSCSRSSTWILDTCATHHVLYDQSLFSYVSPISNAFVNLPNGQTAPVTHIGNIKLTPLITLSSALYVPSFYFNLIKCTHQKFLLYCLLYSQSVPNPRSFTRDSDWEG